MKDGKRLSTWSKEVKKKLIDDDLTTNEFATSIGMSRAHVSSVINGNVYSEPTVKAISIALGVPVSKNTLAMR